MVSTMVSFRGANGFRPPTLCKRKVVFLQGSVHFHVEGIKRNELLRGPPVVPFDQLVCFVGGGFPY